ncbi:MAG: hypothetical protein KDB00_01675, partial [Planctomycetales bacterium]|nr:hypothetical protein [Planctomycetales bacterium]
GETRLRGLAAESQLYTAKRLMTWIGGDLREVFFLPTDLAEAPTLVRLFSHDALSIDRERQAEFGDCCG